MKKIALLLLAFSIASCQKDEDTGPDGDIRDAFVAAWNCEETSQQNGNSTFEVHINKSSSDSSLITIENLYNYGFSFVAYAEVNAAGTGFVIPSQLVQGNNVSGSGSMLGSITINMSYVIDNGSGADSVAAVLSKK